MKKQKKKKLIIGIIIAVIVVLTAAYFGAAAYFTKHFWFRTEINGEDMSLKTAADLATWLDTETADYELTFLEKDGTKETVSGSEIELRRKESDETEKLLKKQNALLWPKSLFEKTVETVLVKVEYSEQMLMEKVHKLRCFGEEQTLPENARPEYNGNEYVIRAEIPGSGADQEKLEEKSKEYVA